MQRVILKTEETQVKKILTMLLTAGYRGSIYCILSCYSDGSGVNLTKERVMG